MTTERVRVRLIVDTGFVGAEHDAEIEIPRDEWDAMTADERDHYLAGELEMMISNCIEAYYELVDDE